MTVAHRILFAAFISVLLLFPACAHQPTQTGFQRDGVSYGVTEGRFRGRWWNYYERGASFLQGGLWTEAEQDFRTALSMRSRDQRWARTYGLHLVPQYFPHRELGIALFRQGNVEEALQELETSLAMTFSGRTAYYIDLVRREWISANGLDSAAPTITIESPTSGDVLGAMRTTVSGVAADDTYVASITINDLPVTLRVAQQEVLFSEEIPIHRGDNTILVEVRDLTGKISRHSILLTTDHDGPVLSFDRPLAIPGTLRGVASDVSGLSSLRVGEQKARIEMARQGLFSFELTLDQNALGAPLTFIASDALGNETRGTLSPDAIAMPVPASGTLDDALMFASNWAPEGYEAVPFLGGVILVAQNVLNPQSNAPVVTIRNIPEGARFIGLDEVQVQVQVTGAENLNELYLLGQEESPGDLTRLPLLQGRETQLLSRRIPLKDNENLIVARAGQHDPALARDEALVTRVPLKIDEPSEHLSVALLADAWAEQSPSLDQDTLNGTLDAFQNALNERFDFVSRAALDAVLTEKALVSSALVSERDRKQLSTLIPAEAFIIGSVRPVEQDVIELSARLISTATTFEMVLVDIAGKQEDLKDLTTDLARLLRQAYPRVPGVITRSTSESQAITNLGRIDGITRNMPCTVFKYGTEEIDPLFGTSMGKPIKIVTRASITELQDRQSTIGRLAGEPLQPLPEVPEGEHVWVITK